MSLSERRVELRRRPEFGLDLEQAVVFGDAFPIVSIEYGLDENDWAALRAKPRRRVALSRMLGTTTSSSTPNSLLSASTSKRPRPR